MTTLKNIIQKHKTFIITLLAVGVVSVFLKFVYLDTYIRYGTDVKIYPFLFIPEPITIIIIVVVVVLTFLFSIQKIKKNIEQRKQKKIAIFIVTFFVLFSTSVFYYWPHVRYSIGYQTVKIFGSEYVVDMVFLSLNDGFAASDAEELAEIVSGRILYEHSYSQFFVIELDTRTAKDLDAAVEILQRLGDPRIEDVSRNLIVEYNY